MATARQQQGQPQYLDDDHQRISEFAADYFDDEEERATFVDTLLERRGYVRTSGWSAPPPEPPAGNGPPSRRQAPGYFKR